MDRKAIDRALKKAGGNKSEAARILGITRNKLNYHLRETDRLKKPDAQRRRYEDITELEAHRLKREIAKLRQRLKEVLNEKIENEDRWSVFGGCEDAILDPPVWIKPKRLPKSKAIATALFSDCHYDEVVRPETINWVNGYDRAIALKRTQNYFDNVIRLARDYTTGAEIEGLVLGMLGDIVSGNIHEELRRTNAGDIIDTCVFWSEQIAAGIYQLLEYFPKIFSYGVVGNHGRLDKKPSSKNKVTDNFDYLIYRMLEKEFKNVPEIEIVVSTGAAYRYTVYGTKFHVRHGDSFKGGTGIAGALSPLLLGHHRLSKSEAAKGTPFDILMLGHWHQRINLAGLVVNNCLKGYDEYSEDKGFMFAPPDQSFFLVDPVYGKTQENPIRVQDKSEGWMAARPKHLK